MFGIPCGPREITGPDGGASSAAVDFLRGALGMTEKDAHSLKKVEEFLKRDISETSCSLEHDCFQVAFVIFVMGHLLAPCAKHDYATIDYWGALKRASDIPNYNSAGYVIKSIVEGARKVQSDSQVTIPGCHLFLQVCFVDCCYVWLTLSFL